VKYYDSSGLGPEPNEVGHPYSTCNVTHKKSETQTKIFFPLQT